MLDCFVLQILFMKFVILNSLMIIDIKALFFKVFVIMVDR